MALFSLSDLIATINGRRAMSTKVENTEDSPVPVQLTGSNVGYSNDTKPTGKKGETFLELDTLDVYVNDGTKWVKIT